MNFDKYCRHIIGEHRGSEELHLVPHPDPLLPSVFLISTRKHGILCEFIRLQIANKLDLLRGRLYSESYF